jgi:protein SCO1
MRLTVIILLLFAVVLIASCGQAPAANEPSAAVKRFPLTGKVTAVDKARKTATVDHDEVKGYMPPMTMDFEVREDWVWDDLTAGAEIKADLVVDNANGKYWLEKIGILAAARPDQEPAPGSENAAQIGKPVPDFTLTNQDGKKISIKDFAGKALAVTFIYRECPLPEYCILMSRNFSDLAIQLNAEPDVKDKVSLLTISFDPARDTPEKLKQYGLGYMGKDAKDLGVWQLAVGSDAEVRKVASFFGLKYSVSEEDKTQINHTLVTAVINPRGEVTRIFTGNSWTPADLRKELNAAITGL